MTGIILCILFWLCVVLVAYVYALYPTILWLLARLFPAPPVTPPEPGAYQPSVTLLISAYCEECVIQSKLENCLALDYPPGRLQILVAVDGEEDCTREIVGSYSPRGVELSFSPCRTGKINAIRRGVEAARGEIVVLTDANTFFAPDALIRLVEPLADPTIGAVSGAKVIAAQDCSLATSEGLYWKYESFIKEQESRLGSCTGVSGEIFAFRRNLFVSPPPAIINDDFYLAMSILRQGRRVVYVPQALTYEKASLSSQDEVTRRSRIVAGRYQILEMGIHLLPFNHPLIAWQVISHKFLRPIVPLAMLGVFLTNLAAVLLPIIAKPIPSFFLSGTFGQACLSLQVLFYALAWLGTRLQPGHDLHGAGKMLYLPAFLVNSNLAAVSGLGLFISGRQTNLWQRVARKEN